MVKRIFIALAVVVFIGLIGLGVFGQRGLIKLEKLRADRGKLEQQADQIKKENEGLKKNIELLTNDLKYLEKLARQKLGMVRPDEVIITVPGQGNTVNHHNPQANSGDKKENKK